MGRSPAHERDVHLLSQHRAHSTLKEACDTSEGLMSRLPFFIAILLTSAPAWALTELKGLDVVTDRSIEWRASDSAKASVLVFLSSRCPCSSSHEASLKELAREYAPKGIRFVGLNSNADEEPVEVREHFKHSGFSFPVVRDRASAVADRLGALKTPHAFVISREGEILYQGGVDDSARADRAKNHFLRAALEAVAQGKTPEVREARALGCRIRR